MTDKEFRALKEDLKGSVGKVKHHVKRAADSIGQKLKDGRAKINAKYERGVTSTQKNPIVDKMADLTAGLTEKDEEELLKNEDDTFRKIRKVIVNGTVILTPFIIGIPIKMIDTAVQNNVDLKNAEKYDKIYEREILWTEDEIKKRKKEGKDTEDLQKYLTNLKKSRAKTQAHIQKLKEAEAESSKKDKAAKESMRFITEGNTLNPFVRFTLMQREDFRTDEDFDNALIGTFEQLLYGAAQSVDYHGKFGLDKETPIVESLNTEPVVDTGKRKSAYIITNGIMMEAISKDKELMKAFENHSGYGHQISFNNGSSDKYQIYGFDYEKLGLFNTTGIDSKVKSLVESINGKIAYTDCQLVIGGKDSYPVITLEGITQTAQDVVRKAVHTARNVLPEESPVKNAERASEPLDDAVNKIINGVRDALSHDKREEIVQGKYRFKLVRIIAKCIAYGGLAILVHPAVAAIAFLGKMAYDRHIDRNERSAIVHDLESELEICKEKIKDAEAKGDNENKYKLMRIRKSLETEVGRIKLHLDK